MTEFKYACSLGNYCFSAALLDMIKVRDRALPFDWLFTTPKSTIEILKNDFKDFLNPKYYTDIYDVGLSHGGRQAGHTLYHKNFFNHKNPRDKRDYDYYVRCVDRFREFMKIKDKKLFICSYKNLKSKMGESIMSDVFELNNSLSDMTQNYHLLCHINYSNSDELDYEISEIGNVTFFELYTKQDNHGLGYGNDEDNEIFFKIFNELFKIKK
jgi:hypothetical protein